MNFPFGNKPSGQLSNKKGALVVPFLLANFLLALHPNLRLLTFLATYPSTKSFYNLGSARAGATRPVDSNDRRFWNPS